MDDVPERGREGELMNGRRRGSRLNSEQCWSRWFLALLPVWLQGWQCQLLHKFGPDLIISATFGWIAMKFWTHVHVPHDEAYWLFWYLIRLFLVHHQKVKVSLRVAQNIVRTFMVSRGWISLSLWIPRHLQFRMKYLDNMDCHEICFRHSCSPLVPQGGQHFCFLVRYLDNYWMDCHEISYTHACSQRDEL